MQIFSLMCCEGTFGQESERARKANLLPHSCCSFLKHSQACCLNFGSLSSSFLVHACWWNCQASFTSNFWCTGRIFFYFFHFHRILENSHKILIKQWFCCILQLSFWDRSFSTHSLGHQWLIGLTKWIMQSIILLLL